MVKRLAKSVEKEKNYDRPKFFSGTNFLLAAILFRRWAGVWYFVYEIMVTSTTQNINIIEIPDFNIFFMYRYTLIFREIFYTLLYMTDLVPLIRRQVLRVRTQIACRFIFWTHLGQTVWSQAEKNWFFKKKLKKSTKLWNLGKKTGSWNFDLNTKNCQNGTSNRYPITSRWYLIQENFFQNIDFSNFLERKGAGRAKKYMKVFRRV